MKKFKKLEAVVLERDLPEHGLRKGDVGTVLELYKPDGLEVEFVTTSGTAGALVTLRTSDVRHVEGSDLGGVRPFRKKRSA